MRHLPLFFLLLVLPAGCKPQDGDLLSQVFHRAGQKINDSVGGSPSAIVGRLRGRMSQVGLAERVAGRLSWDRHLDGVYVEAEGLSDGTVRLRGEVADLSKKQRVLDLTKATVGVERVEDGLTLPPEEK